MKTFEFPVIWVLHKSEILMSFQRQSICPSWEWIGSAPQQCSAAQGTCFDSILGSTWYLTIPCSSSLPGASFLSAHLESSSRLGDARPKGNEPVHHLSPDPGVNIASHCGKHPPDTRSSVRDEICAVFSKNTALEH